MMVASKTNAMPSSQQTSSSQSLGSRLFVNERERTVFTTATTSNTRGLSIAKTMKRVACGITVAWCCLFVQPELKAHELPNVVIIYADDLGYGDLSCYNAKAAYETPRIDQLAREGIRFTDSHSPSTICSPSRYGLFSGQLIYRSTGGGGVAFEGPGGPSFLKPGTLTIAQMLKTRGYRTGVFGKWHVGLTWFDEQGQPLAGGFETALKIDYARSSPLVDGPNVHGFDRSFVTPNCPTTDPLYLYIEDGNVVTPATRRHDSDSLPNLEGKWRWDNDEGWMAEGYEFLEADLLFLDKTTEFIRNHQANHSDEPFFAVLCTQICHAPVLPAQEFQGATNAGPRGDFVQELDSITGRLLDLLEELDVADNTIVILNSDNGPETMHVAWMRQDYDHDPAGDWRGMKRDGWEGGHRVPMIVRWPKYIPAAQVSDQLCSTTDLFATLASIVDYPLPDEVAVDSFDLLPAWVGSQKDDEPIRPWLLTQSFRGQFQVRQGNWKYLDHGGSGGNDYGRGMLREFALPESEPSLSAQLYDLASDPQETHNLLEANPDKVQELQEILNRCKDEGRSAPRQRVPLGINSLTPVSKR